MSEESGTSPPTSVVVRQTYTDDNGDCAVDSGCCAWHRAERHACICPMTH